MGESDYKLHDTIQILLLVSSFGFYICHFLTVKGLTQPYIGCKYYLPLNGCLITIRHRCLVAFAFLSYSSTEDSLACLGLCLSGMAL